MFGKDLVKLKGHKCDIVGKLFTALKKRSLCFFDDMTIINAPKFKGLSVLHCKQCRKVWQRDVNTANNMMTIARAIWSGEERPKVFKPKKKVSP
ncbi:MAG: hypothetical protein EXX96DRAFT_293761 [Benjaminiella poitrasii]|nr:MAG: hypothetical protein EXX96DRAFT_293761 [Benjaminiella poitrasii]